MADYIAVHVPETPLPDATACLAALEGPHTTQEELLHVVVHVLRSVLLLLESGPDKGQSPEKQ